MEEKPVSKYNQILHSLLGGKSTVNKLYEKTGLSKNNDTMKIKKDLEKARIVIEKDNKKLKDDDFHSQSHIVELSEFGYSVALFLKNLDEFDKHFKLFLDKVDNDIGKYINNLDGLELKAETRRKLQREGWGEKDLSNYFSFVNDLYHFEIAILECIIDVTFHKYAYFQTKFNPNTLAIEFLRKVIGDKIMHFSFLKMDLLSIIAYGKDVTNDNRDKYFQEKNKYKIISIEKRYTNQFISIIDDVCNRGFIFSERVSKETKNLLFCMKSLTELKGYQMGLHIDLLQKDIEQMDSDTQIEQEDDAKKLAIFRELFPDS